MVVTSGEAGDHFFIGISKRTNGAGARQLAEWLTNFAHGHSCGHSK